MANKDLTPLAQWDTPRSPTNGDAPDMAFDEDCHQRAANRSQWLRARLEAAQAASAAAAVASLEAAVTGDTNWHDSGVVMKTVSGGVVGQVLNILLTCDAVENSSGGNTTTFRIKCVDNGVTTYLDGAAQVINADGLRHRVVLATKYTLLSATAVLTLQLSNNNNAVSCQLFGGWSILTW